MSEEAADTLVALTADVVASHLANNEVAVADVPELIASVHAALSGLGKAPVEPAEKQSPAVSIRSSIKPDYLVCLEDGQKVTMLKRYIATRFNLTPKEYRAKWNLPVDYPMVAPNYSARRKELAVASGLGLKRKAKVPAADAPSVPKGRGRAKKAEQPAAAAAPKKRGRAKAADLPVAATPKGHGRRKMVEAAE